MPQGDADSSNAIYAHGSRDRVRSAALAANRARDMRNDTAEAEGSSSDLRMESWRAHDRPGGEAQREPDAQGLHASGSFSNAGRHIAFSSQLPVISSAGSQEHATGGIKLAQSLASGSASHRARSASRRSVSGRSNSGSHRTTYVMSSFGSGQKGSGFAPGHENGTNEHPQLMATATNGTGVRGADARSGGWSLEFGQSLEMGQSKERARLPYQSSAQVAGVRAVLGGPGATGAGPWQQMGGLSVSEYTSYSTVSDGS